MVAGSTSIEKSLRRPDEPPVNDRHHGPVAIPDDLQPRSRIDPPERRCGLEAPLERVVVQPDRLSTRGRVEVFPAQHEDAIGLDGRPVEQVNAVGAILGEGPARTLTQGDGPLQ